MAIFGTLEVIKNQADNKKFDVAFNYIEEVMTKDTQEYNRLINYPLNTFEKIELDENNFALEQVYLTKDNNACFFESHQMYIDIQLIADGEEIIEVTDCNALTISSSYNETMDLIKYKDSELASSIVLKKGDIAIFYPSDAHKPCIKTLDANKVIKTVIKVKV